MGKEYFQLLKDPRWQKKRLEVMQRADFTCESCCESSDELHVHHGYYEQGKLPWEYPDKSYHCLCGLCHIDAETARKEIRALAGSLWMESQFQLLDMLRYLSSLSQVDALLLLSKFQSDAQTEVERMIDEARSA